MDWSRGEVEAVVADYLHMLTLELSGQSYSKTAHRRALKPNLHDRSDGSIERKHQNISAILIELGCPYIAGYKPLGNFQGLLHDVVVSRLAIDRDFDRSALDAVARPAGTPILADEAGVLVEPPERRVHAERVQRPFVVPTRGVVRDYLDRESRNQSLGLAGEAFVVDFERMRLHRSGQRRLSDRVEHVSRSKGDGLGYDVLSFDVDGRERLIEVKTTAFGKETPFFVTQTELQVSEAVPQQFHLYRVFEFRRQPRMFDLPGNIRERCVLDPVSYRASFG